MEEKSLTREELEQRIEQVNAQSIRLRKEIALARVTEERLAERVKSLEARRARRGK